MSIKPKEPEHEPVAQLNKDPDTGKLYVQWTLPWALLADGTKFYTTPPQRKPLTDEQRREIILKADTVGQAIAMVESAHGIKE